MLIDPISCDNCVNNKMLKHDWLFTALIYGLIGSFGSKLSDLTCPITNPPGGDQNIESHW